MVYFVFDEDDYQEAWELHSNQYNKVDEIEPMKYKILIKKEKLLIKKIKEEYELQIKKEIKYDLMNGKCDICPALQEIYNSNQEKKEKLKNWKLITINCREEDWEKCWDKVKNIKN